MALTQDDLVRIEALLADAGKGGQPLADFRQRFPGVSLTRCDVQDMSGETAYREFAQFNLYLVDGRDHCWRLTGDPTAATGVVVAARN
jgi:hypothetical protein